MKKILSVLLSLAVAVGALGGCSAHEDIPGPSPSPSPEVSQAAEPYQIGLVQYKDHAGLNTLRESFMGRLEEWGWGEDQVAIDYQNAGGDPAKAVEICQEFVEQGVDMIVAIATPAAQAAISAVAGTDVAVVFTGVDQESVLGLTEGEAPQSAITGVVSPTPVSALIDLALQADPELQTLGLLYDPSDPGSQAEIETAKAYCGEKGLEVAEATVSSEEEVQQAMTDLCARAGAVFTPADNTVAPQAAQAAQAAKDAGVPWYVGSDVMVQAGALASMGVTDREKGVQAADMAVQLIGGGNIEEVPVYTFTDATTSVNQTTLAALPELSFPSEVLSSAFVYQ